jgi:hypothetical protein
MLILTDEGLPSLQVGDQGMKRIKCIQYGWGIK